MELTSEQRKNLLRVQQGDITGYLVYSQLARKIEN
jgi:hypothetical protein